MSDDVKMPDHRHSEQVHRLVRDFFAEKTDSVATHVKGPFAAADFIRDADYNVAGCYIIYDTDGSLSYIGQSKKSMRERVENHLKPATQSGASWRRSLPPTYVEAVPIYGKSLDLEKVLTRGTDDLPTRLDKLKDRAFVR